MVTARMLDGGSLYAGTCSRPQISSAIEEWSRKSREGRDAKTDEVT